MIININKINKLNLTNDNIILFYGDNDGLKNEVIEKIINDIKPGKIIKYQENEISLKPEIFYDQIFTKSLFEETKIIIVNQVTDKILKLVNEIDEKKIDEVFLILNANYLEKKSKLRIHFEKKKNILCIPVYPDNNETLIKQANLYLREKNLPLSQSNINFLIDKCNGQRSSLKNEIDKISIFSNGKKVNFDDLVKLIYLNKNHEISVLVDNCLLQNLKKTMNIINDNKFNHEDNILIIRSMLNKAKKILKLSLIYENNNNLDETISSAQPPIFWKDKEIIKQQIYKWKPKKIKELIFNLAKIELDIKKNFENSVNILINYIIDICKIKINN